MDDLPPADRQATIRTSRILDGVVVPESHPAFLRGRSAALANTLDCFAAALARGPCTSDALQGLHRLIFGEVAFKELLGMKLRELLCAHFIVRHDMPHPKLLEAPGVEAMAEMPCNVGWRCFRCQRENPADRLTCRKCRHPKDAPPARHAAFLDAPSRSVVLAGGMCVDVVGQTADAWVLASGDRLLKARSGAEWRWFD